MPCLNEDTLKMVSESMTKHVGNGFINFGSANAEILAIFTVLWVDLRVNAKMLHPIINKQYER